MQYDFIFFFQAEDGIRDATVTGVQTCALPILPKLANAFFFSRSAYFSGTCSAMPASRGSVFLCSSETLSLLAPSRHRRLHPLLEDVRGIHPGSFAKDAGQFLDAKPTMIAFAPLEQITECVAQTLLPRRLRTDGIVHRCGHQRTARKKILPNTKVF